MLTLPRLLSHRGPTTGAGHPRRWTTSGAANPWLTLSPQKKPSPSSQGGGCGGGGAAVSSGSGPARAAARGGGAPNATVAAECSKSAEEIVTWLRTLPESHVPEKSRENLIAIVEDHGHDGSSFSKYVQQVPPEVCAPKHAMKLKAAWGNVLKEQEAKAIAMSNLSNAPRQKATMIVI